MTGLDRLREAAENPAWCPYGSHVEIDPQVALALVEYVKAHQWRLQVVSDGMGPGTYTQASKRFEDAEARLLSLLREDA